MLAIALHASESIQPDLRCGNSIRTHSKGKLSGTIRSVQQEGDRMTEITCSNKQCGAGISLEGNRDKLPNYHVICTKCGQEEMGFLLMRDADPNTPSGNQD